MADGRLLVKSKNAFRLSRCHVRSSVRASGHIGYCYTKIGYLMNGSNNFDKTVTEYSVAPTGDLIRFWRSANVVLKASTSTLERRSSSSNYLPHRRRWEVMFSPASVDIGMFVNNFLTPNVRLSPNLVSHTLGHEGREDFWKVKVKGQGRWGRYALYLNALEVHLWTIYRARVCWMLDVDMCMMWTLLAWCHLQRPQVVTVERRSRLHPDEFDEEVFDGGEAVWSGGAGRVQACRRLAVWVETDLVNKSDQQVVDVMVQRRRHLDVLAAHCSTHAMSFCIYVTHIKQFQLHVYYANLTQLVTLCFANTKV